MSYNPTLDDIKKLREQTGAGISDCKKALIESDGDLVESTIWLRKHNLASAGKRVGRFTNEGCVFISISAYYASMIEISCETDFVAMTETVSNLGKFLVNELARTGAVSLSDAQEDALKEVAGSLKENLSVKRIISFSIGENEVVGEYLHSKNNLGVIVKAKVIPTEKAREVHEMLRDIAMHVAACTPSFLSRDKVDSGFLEQQKKIAEGQIEELRGKSEQVIQKVLQGKINKQIAAACLLDQPFIKNEAVTVEGHIKAVAREIGADISLVDFAYIRVGQG